MLKEYMFFQGKKYPILNREIENRDGFTYRKTTILYEKKDNVVIVEKKADISALLVRYANSFQKLELGKLNRKNFLILNGIFAALYFSTDEGEIPVSWFQENLGINEIFKKDLTAIRKAVPKELFKDTNEDYKIFKKISLVRSCAGTQGEEMVIKYQLDKRALKYFKNVVRNFTFLNLDELVRLKSVYSMKLLTFLRMFHGKRSFVKLEWKKACKIMGFEEKMNNRKKFNLFNEAVQELSQYYKIENEIHNDITNPNRISDKFEFWLFFDTHAENVPLEKVKWEKEKVENLKKANEKGNKILEENESIHIEDMKRIREYEKNMFKNSNFDNWNYQEVCTQYFKGTESEIENVRNTKKVNEYDNFSEREKKHIEKIITTKTGKKLAVPKDDKIPVGCNFSKFAIPQNVQEEILRGVETIFRYATIEDETLEKLTKERIENMTIYELIKYLTKIGNWKYLENGKSKSFSVKLFYDVVSGTTNAQTVIQEIKEMFMENEKMTENISENLKNTSGTVETEEYKQTEDVAVRFDVVEKPKVFSNLEKSFNQIKRKINEGMAQINLFLTELETRDKEAVKRFKEEIHKKYCECENRHLEWSVDSHPYPDLNSLTEEAEIIIKYKETITLYQNHYKYLQKKFLEIADYVDEVFSTDKEKEPEEIVEEIKLNPTTNYSKSQLIALEEFEVVSKEKIEKYQKEREDLKLG